VLGLIGVGLAIAGAWLVGRPLTAIDLYAAYTRDPEPFRFRTVPGPGEPVGV